MAQESKFHMDARGWIALGCWTLVILVLGMIYFDRRLLDSDAFLILATAIVITGWVQGPVGWAYQATKGGGELAEKNAVLVEKAAVKAAAEPRQVEVMNPPSNPVPTEDTAKSEELPPYARP